MKNPRFSVWPAVLSFVIVFAIAVSAVLSMGAYRDSLRGKEVQNIESTISRSLAQCYALEGSYPPDLEYLSENYGLILDTEKYIFHYDVVGANVMPVVYVLPKNQDQTSGTSTA